MEYYDGTKLLSLKDRNGKEPEIIICTGNRTAGKTTYFNRLLVNRFKKGKGKFLLLYDNQYEIEAPENKFFDDIKDLFFQSDKMSSKIREKGLYTELFLNNVSCGYAICIKKATKIKEISHVFRDVSIILKDEFQKEDNRYVNNEVDKVISIHTSVARGHGKQVRFVPLILVGNSVSLINPYYTALGISSLLKNDTKFLRGNGFVLEMTTNESAKKAQSESAFMNAFNSGYLEYASQNVYLNDNTAFIQKITAPKKYLYTFSFGNNTFAVWSVEELGILYCDKSVDYTFPIKIAVTTSEHNVNYVMLKNNDYIISDSRFYFERGGVRFKDLQCKESFMKLISY